MRVCLPDSIAYYRWARFLTARGWRRWPKRKVERVPGSMRSMWDGMGGWAVVIEARVIDGWGGNNSGLSDCHRCRNGSDGGGVSAMIGAVVGAGFLGSRAQLIEDEDKVDRRLESSRVEGE